MTYSNRAARRRHNRTRWWCRGWRERAPTWPLWCTRSSRSCLYAPSFASPHLVWKFTLTHSHSLTNEFSLRQDFSHRSSSPAASRFCSQSRTPHAAKLCTPRKSRDDLLDYLLLLFFREAALPHAHYVWIYGTAQCTRTSRSPAYAYI